MIRASIAIVVAYLVAAELLAHTTTTHGVLTPERHVDVPLLVLTVLVLVLRLLALFVVPALLVYRVSAVRTSTRRLL